MIQSAPISYPPHPAWFCLKSQPKHEHIAALHLRRRVEKIDVFCPRLRIRKNTRRGPVWFIEPLFPGYLFAQFDPADSVQTVKSTPGVSTIVGFGQIIPVIQEEIIRELRADFDQNEIHEVSNEPRTGDCITIATGPFQGLKAEIIRVLPGPQRVQVLMEILGRTTRVELAAGEIIEERRTPTFLATNDASPEAPVGLQQGARSPLLTETPNGQLPSGGVAQGQQMSR